MRPGGYTRGLKQAKKEREYAREQCHQARQEVTRLRQEDELLASRIACQAGYPLFSSSRGAYPGFRP